MSRYFVPCVRMFAFAVAAHAFTASARAQLNWNNTAGVRTAGQLFARSAANANPFGSGMSSFNYSPYYSSSAYGSPANTWGAGSQPATPWSTQHGAWIQQAGSFWAQDDIARSQAYMQRYFQWQDYEFRRLQLNRAKLDAALYEKMVTPPPEMVREENRLQRLIRARNTPPLEEIASGASLNELLTNIRRVQARDTLVGFSQPIDPEILKHINVSATNDARGSNELFKPGAFPKWPIVFTSENFAADRKAIMAALNEMSRLLSVAGEVDAKAVEARQAVDLMKDKLYDMRFQVPFAQYVSALDFLTKLTDTINVLAKSDAANYLNGTYAARGKTVNELVEYMMSKGLTFAKATPGDETYYSMLYQLLVPYEIDVSRKMEQQTLTQSKKADN